MSECVRACVRVLIAVTIENNLERFHSHNDENPAKWFFQEDRFSLIC